LNIQKTIDKEIHFEESLLKMQQYIYLWKVQMNEVIQKLYDEHGPLVAKAFPGRAAILIKLLGLNEKIISGVYEKAGSMKIGHFLPGTRIPIKSDKALLTGNSFPPVIINLAWHISNEIHSYLNNEGFNGQIIDIYSPDMKVK